VLKVHPQQVFYPVVSCSRRLRNIAATDGLGIKLRIIGISNWYLIYRWWSRYHFFKRWRLSRCLRPKAVFFLTLSLLESLRIHHFFNGEAEDFDWCLRPQSRFFDSLFSIRIKCWIEEFHRFSNVMIAIGVKINSMRESKNRVAASWGPNIGREILSSPLNN